MIRDLHRMNEAIEGHWTEAPPEVQAAFRQLAHLLDDPPPLRFRDRIRFAWMSFLAGPDDIKALHEVVLRLRNTLRDIMERENRAIEQVLEDPEIQRSMATGWQDTGEPAPLQEALERLGPT